MVTNVTIYTRRIIGVIQEEGGAFTRELGEKIRIEAMATCPSGETGTLFASHHVDQARASSQGFGGAFATGVVVYNNAHHALWVHEGTGIYGPRGVPIVPVNTEMKKYMHIPPEQMLNPWIWTNLRKGTRTYKNRNPKFKVTTGPDFDPWAHAEEVDGMIGNPWLGDAADRVLWREGF